MARLNFVKKAQKNIYQQGKYIEYESKKGKRIGQKLRRLDRTQPANKDDKIMIAKGEPYYWWAFMNGGKHFSKDKPRRSQLTQSNFFSQLWDIEDRIAEFHVENKDDFEEFRDEIRDELENLKDETQSSLDNIPEQLQSAPTGEMMQERIDALENWIFDIEGVECEQYDEQEIRVEVEEENPRGENEPEADWIERINEEVNEKIQEIVDVAIGELQETSAGL